jgi:hypothetical protein
MCFDPQRLLAFPYANTAQIQSRLYPFHGVQQVVLRRSPTSSSHFFLSLILNLRSLELGQFSIDLFDPTPTAMQSLQNNFLSALNSLFPGMTHPGLLRWSTRSVHYAIDVQTPHVPEYVQLMNRARLPANFGFPLARPGSFYVSSSTGDVTINFYDKANQLHNTARHAPGALQGQNRLRIEVQCQGNKLHHLLRKNRQQSCGLSPQTFLRSTVANAVVQDYYKKTVGYNDFHSLSQALAFIQAGPGRTERKTKLSNFVRLMDQSATVGEAMQSFLNGAIVASTITTVQGSKRCLDNYMKRYLPDLNINPILIPASMNLVSLPNPMPAGYQIP